MKNKLEVEMFILFLFKFLVWFGKIFDEILVVYIILDVIVLLG